MKISTWAVGFALGAAVGAAATFAWMVFDYANAPFHPDTIRTTNSPEKGLFVTVETYHGNGPVDNDFTNIYVHLVWDGKSDKASVLSGEYIEGSKIIWLDRANLRICVSEGLTSTFRNQVTLGDPGHYRTVHVHLADRC